MPHLSHNRFHHPIYRIGEIVQTRQSKLWLQPDFIFKLTSLYKSHEMCIKILHGFSYRVIRERKDEIQKIKMLNNNNEADCMNNNSVACINRNAQTEPVHDDDLSFGAAKKKRLAFLDLLIEASQDGTVLSNDDIREEVDTFMFEVETSPKFWSINN